MDRPYKGGIVTHSSSPRKTAKLSDTLHKRVNMYALASSAAGVGVLALAQTAEAKIVYTKANVTIGHNGVLHHQIDLNHDGIKDFSFSYPGTSGGPKSAALMVRPLGKGNEVVSRTSERGYPAALLAGVLVGPKRRFDAYKEQILAGWTTASGPPVIDVGNWVDVKNRYLGIEFMIKGKIHYGWARLSVSVDDDGLDIEGTLTGFAYETIPNKPIITGKTEEPEEGSNDGANPATLNEPTLRTASLGLLAMGSPGLSVWRREESVLAAPAAK
jgi:hypothetical protein